MPVHPPSLAGAPLSGGDQALESGDLLARFDATSPLFCSSPSGQVLARGTHALRRPRGPFDTLRCGLEMLADAESAGVPAVVLGALPFDPSRPACLRVPESFHLAGPLSGAQLSATPIAPVKAQLGEARALMSKEAYRQAVAEAVRRIMAGDLDKVVLARALDVPTDGPVDVRSLLRRLRHQNPVGYTFAALLGLDEGGGPLPVLVGASPELLVSKQGQRVIANPLAGSVPRSADPAEDRSRADALLRSAKDLHEHAVVIESVADALSPLCADLKVPAGPSLVATPRLWHLSTRVEGRVRSDDVTSLELACAMHPTPAVCGRPAERARSLIRELETAPRDFFAGAVGYCDSRGQGDWIVTVRSAEVRPDAVRVYAGAGIVGASDPEAELRETEAKLGTMLQALVGS